MTKRRIAFAGLAPTLPAASMRPRAVCPRSPPKMLESNTLVAVATVLAGVGGGIGLVAWTEQQGERGAVRTNVQTCFDCKGAGVVTCPVCQGTGRDPLGDLDAARAGPCKYCDGKKVVTCTNCNGTGIQPRYLDRLSPEDFMD